MSNKIFTAFISSAFESLRQKREQVIDTLLDFRIMPIGMEYFTASSDGNFSDIMHFIDLSDFFILLLGKQYSSCNGEGISWTESEYNYAMLKKKPIVTILCEDLIKNLSADENDLSEDEKKQVAFAKRVQFARKETKEFNINRILTQYFGNPGVFSDCIGWTRLLEPGMSEEQLENWRNEHRVYDLSGTWYHVHLSEVDESYIRIGSMLIRQDFSPNSYTKLEISAENYSVRRYDPEKNIIIENRMKSSRFSGEYKLEENGQIFGIFRSLRQFADTFDSKSVDNGIRRGIHDFNIDISEEVTEHFEGEFHDEAPSPKFGRIFLFRSREERDAFVMDNRSEVITQK